MEGARNSPPWRRCHGGGVVDRNSRVVAPPSVRARRSRNFARSNFPSAGMYRCPACPRCPGSFSQTYHYFIFSSVVATAPEPAPQPSRRRRRSPSPRPEAATGLVSRQLSLSDCQEPRCEVPSAKCPWVLSGQSVATPELEASVVQPVTVSAQGRQLPPN